MVLGRTTNQLERSALNPIKKLYCPCSLLGEPLQLASCQQWVLPRSPMVMSTTYAVCYVVCPALPLHTWPCCDMSVQMVTLSPRLACCCTVRDFPTVRDDNTCQAFATRLCGQVSKLEQCMKHPLASSRSTPCVCIANLQGGSLGDGVDAKRSC